VEALKLGSVTMLTSYVDARGKRNQKRAPTRARFSHPMVPPQRSTVILQK
jgi:hypothetical protein